MSILNEADGGLRNLRGLIGMVYQTLCILSKVKCTKGVWVNTPIYRFHLISTAQESHVN